MSLKWFKSLKGQWRPKCCKQVHRIDQNCKNQVENSSKKAPVKFTIIKFKPNLQVCSKSITKMLLGRADHHEVYAEMKTDDNDSVVFEADWGGRNSGGGGAAIYGGFNEARVNVTLHTNMRSLTYA